jgi:hypothetical protein
MAMITVNGVELPDPAEYTWGLQDVSASDAGRTEDAMMHKNRVGQKRKLNLTWSGLEPADVALILQAVNPEYMEVSYPDAMSNSTETRTFYVGDRSAPIHWWYGTTGRYYNRLSFNFIER